MFCLPNKNRTHQLFQIIKLVNITTDGVNHNGLDPKQVLITYIHKHTH